MPKLPRVSGRTAAKVLERAGFKIVRIAGDHAFLRSDITGRTATVSLTSYTCPVGTLANILRQAGLTIEEFSALLK